MTWNVIVVGAGSSGATLAARLAQAGKRVLLLEAGKDHRSAELPEALRSPNPLRAILQAESWDDLIWPDLDGQRAEGQAASLYWRGRGVGGSSVINGQLAIRPSLADFDEWAAAGCTGWSASEVLPYFVRLETDEQFAGRDAHGSDGPIPIHHPQRDEWGALDAAFADAVLDAGFAYAEDVNAPGATGLSPYPVNSFNSRRVTVNDAYLEPMRDSELLEIRADSLVDRVLFDGDRAVGVVLADGSVEHADEVVLSAGAVHSPAILLRSGIGLAEDLARISVPQLVNLPVGRGLQDHARLDVMLRLSALAQQQPLDTRHTSCILRYSSGDPDGFDSDIVMVSLNQAVLAMQDASTDEYEGCIVAWLNRVHSRGRLVLDSADPRVNPFVKINMLSDERDRRILRAAAHTLADIVRSPRIAEITAQPVEETAAEFFAALESGDEALDAYLLSVTGDTQHGTSTCAMSGNRDGVGVVDPDCRVYGTRGLRVVDASVFPSVPSANTHLTAVMIGERMADRMIAEVEASTEVSVEGAAA